MPKTRKIEKSGFKGNKRYYNFVLAAVCDSGRCCCFMFSAIAKGSIGYMPPVEQLENPIDKYASQVVSADGKTLGIYAHSQDNRIMVNYNDLSPDLVKALIATEMSVLPNIAVSMRRDCFVQLLREAF